MPRNMNTTEFYRMEQFWLSRKTKGHILSLYIIVRI